MKEFYKSESESENDESESVKANHIEPACNEAAAESAIQEDPAQIQENNETDLQASSIEPEPETSTGPILHAGKYVKIKSTFFKPSFQNPQKPNWKLKNNQTMYYRSKINQLR